MEIVSQIHQQKIIRDSYAIVVHSCDYCYQHYSLLINIFPNLKVLMFYEVDRDQADPILPKKNLNFLAHKVVNIRRGTS